MLHSVILEAYQQSAWTHNCFACFDDFLTKIIFYPKSNVNSVEKELLHSKNLEKKYQQTSWIHISFSCLEIFETKLMFRESSKVNDVKKNVLPSVILNPYQQSSRTQLLFMPLTFWDQNNILPSFKFEQWGISPNPWRKYHSFSCLKDFETKMVFHEISNVNNVKKNMLHSVILEAYQQSAWTHNCFSCLDN